MLVRGADVQAVVEERGEHIACMRVPALDEPDGDQFLVGKAGIAERRHVGEKGLAGRLRERRRGKQDGGERQPEPPPARRAVDHL